jgi:hypothetical protein
MNTEGSDLKVRAPNTRVFYLPPFWLQVFLAFLSFSCPTLGLNPQTQKGPQKWSHLIHTIYHIMGNFLYPMLQLHSIDVGIIHILVWNCLVDGQHIGRNINLKEKKLIVGYYNNLL